MKRPFIKKGGKKIYSEEETRRRLLNTAEYWGIKKDVQQIFEKYDRYLKGCTNEKERKAIAAMGAQEVHNLFGAKGGLTVDGQIISAPKTEKDNTE